MLAHAPNFQRIPLSLIDIAPYNARRFEENMTPARDAKFRELVDSVREKGVIQPIAVRPKGERFEVIAGERRFRASCEVAKESGGIEGGDIPSVIYDVDDDAAFDIMTTENLQREDLSPVEKAQSFKAALERAGNSNDALKDLSRRFGVAPHAIRFQIALLELPQAVLSAWDEGKITAAHAEQLTRLAGEQNILEALTECLRRRFTVAELSEYIQGQKPLLKTALFDQAECAGCVSNSSVQGSLFSPTNNLACCLNPTCFKAKQGGFFEMNWKRSKASANFGTQDFRFKDDLAAGSYRTIGEQAETRCQSCPAFVTVVSLAGTIVKGQERVCVGEQKCYDSLYGGSLPCPAAERHEDRATEVGKENGGLVKVGKEVKAEGKEGKNQLDEKKAANRAESERESLYARILPETATAISPGAPEAVRIYLCAMALTSNSALDVLRNRLGIKSVLDREGTVEALLQMDVNDLLPTLMQMALPQLMSTEYNSTATPNIRRQIADLLGLELPRYWKINEEYLGRMTKAEIVAMGEEQQTALWNDPKIVSYRDEHFPKKSWMGLKKGELIDCIIKSGTDLTNRIPQEMAR
ncbi:MAG: ParB/RepB/Spo0J family partition protein [Desulfuromonas thiophila]|nr:ParB/RepB/Spo0J family partition protein [Desulfuromonas thiophila]